MASRPDNPERPEWDACPPGELRSLRRRLRGKARQRQAVLPGVAGVAALVLAGVYFTAAGDPSVDEISCGVCISRFEEYGAYLASLKTAQPGQPGPEADATLLEVRRHLEGCRNCREKFERAYPGVSDLAALGAGTALALGLFGVVRSREIRSSVWPTGP